MFFGAQTTHKPKKYDRAEASDNAAISARLPYLMATSRFAHYLKVIGRDKIGSFMEASDCESWLNRWIQNYANSNQSPGTAMKLQYPLREAKVTVREVPGRPGSYNAVAWLRPWLQLEELTTSMRLVARIPKANSDASKQFFFEKKNQKLLVRCRALASEHATAESKFFCFFFFKKRSA